MEKGGKEKGKRRERGKSEVKLGFREGRKRERERMEESALERRCSLGKRELGRFGVQLRKGREKWEKREKNRRNVESLRRLGGDRLGKGLGRLERSEKGWKGTWWRRDVGDGRE